MIRLLVRVSHGVEYFSFSRVQNRGVEAISPLLVLLLESPVAFGSPMELGC
ncbi:hypothetical protein FGB62_524g01, partial [Gracilaria domingensis]